MDNLTEKLKEALPEQNVPHGFDELVKNAYNPDFKTEEPPLPQSPKAYIFLLVAIVFVLLILIKNEV